MDLFFFFKRNSVNSLISICLSDLKDYGLLVSTKKPKLMIKDQKLYLPGGLTNGQGSLPVAIKARMGQSGRLLMSKPGSCKIISKSDQRFLRTRFFKNFFMSVYSKSPPFIRAIYIDRSQFCHQFLKRVTQGTFLWNYFKIWQAVLERKFF